MYGIFTGVLRKEVRVFLPHLYQQIKFMPRKLIRAGFRCEQYRDGYGELSAIVFVLASFIRKKLRAID